MKSLVILLLLAAAAKPTIAASPSLDSHRVAWTSERVHRVLVTVAAAEIGEREMDDAPAALIFDAKRSIGARIDVRTIEVVRVDPATGQPLPGDGWTYAPQPEHRTFRWLDDAIPRDFPEVPGSLSRRDKPVVRLAANVGHTYAATGTWEAGRLTFIDFDGDGDTDLVIGDTFGDVHFAENVGDTSQPVFAELFKLGSLKQRLMLDAADYDGDRRPDVVAGAANGNVLIWLNNSSEGIVKFDEAFDPGLPPIKQPRLLVVDLNGDGDSDLYSPSTVGSVWIERSFLERGYAVADVITVARKP